MAPRVLWVSPVADIAGVARHFLDAVPRFPGYELSVLCPPGALADELRDRDVTVHTGKFGPAYRLTESLATLRRAFTQVRPDITHSHLSYADIALALAAPRGALLVSTEHGIATNSPSLYHRSGTSAALMARVHHWRLRRFAALIAVSDATAAALTERWRPRVPITVIPNGVDPAPPRPQRTPGLRIVSLARLAPEKGLDRLVEAFAELLRAHPEAHLTLAGVGPLRDSLTTQVERLGLSERVSLPGFVPAQDALNNADVVALLSLSENSPYAVLDGLAHGLGVVATPVGAIPTMLPARCLVDASDTSAVARALAAQGLELDQRPTLGAWPTVAAMQQQIAATYDGLRRSS